MYSDMLALASDVSSVLERLHCPSPAELLVLGTEIFLKSLGVIVPSNSCIGFLADELLQEQKIKNVKETSLLFTFK